MDRTECDAIVELADCEEYGRHVVVDPVEMGDYPEDDRHYGPRGQVLNLDHLMVHGQEGVEQPFPCTYQGEGLPPEDDKPTDFCWEDVEV